MKYFIWLVIAAAVVVWVQRARKSLTAMSGSPAADSLGRRGPFRRQPKAQPETMVQCEHCGIHFPASEAVTSVAGRVFCSEEHLQLASH